MEPRPRATVRPGRGQSLSLVPGSGSDLAPDLGLERNPALHLHPLNAPAPVSVVADERGRPRAVVGPRHHPRHRRVTAVQETWRIDEGWWRARPVSRLYFRVVLEDGRQLTVYRDLCEGSWWAQRY